jgi:hypothetical protein
MRVCGLLVVNIEAYIVTANTVGALSGMRRQPEREVQAQYRASI